MNLTAISRRGIVCVDSQASPREAAKAMRSHHVGSVVVVSTVAGVRHAVGILTDRDLAIEVVARDVDVGRATAGEVASTQLVAVPGSADMGEAVTAMHQHGVRRLLVTGPEGDVIGIVSADDVLEAMTMQLIGLSAALRGGMDREAAERPAAVPTALRPVFLPYGTPGLRQPGAGAVPPASD